MKTKRNLRTPSLTVLAVVSILFSLVASTPCRSEGQDSDCASVLQKWEGICRDLTAKLHEFSAVQDTPVERITQRPLLQGGGDRTIARRISDALQVKEEILKTKREECQALLNLEGQAFSALQGQCQNGKNGLGKDAKKLIKQRNALVERVTVTIADVREVEGRDAGLPYSAGVRGQPDYGQGPNNYWQSYQQMYRRWWGY